MKNRPVLQRGLNDLEQFSGSVSEYYVYILEMAALGETDQMSGVVVLTPSKNTFINLTIDEATRFFDKM